MIVPFRKPDHHGEMLNRALSLDPHWTPARLEELAHACRTLEDDLHIELAGDPDFARRVQETW